MIVGKLVQQQKDLLETIVVFQVRYNGGSQPLTDFGGLSHGYSEVRGSEKWKNSRHRLKIESLEFPERINKGVRERKESKMMEILAGATGRGE